MAVSDYNREKSLDVASATGTPTVSKVQPIYITSGDDSTTGTGQVVIDWTNVSAESDLAVYDETDTLLAYEIEEFFREAAITRAEELGLGDVKAYDVAKAREQLE